jgi:LEA14-like dessication related protein
MTSTIRLSFLLAVLSGLTGCSTWFSSRFEDPQIELRHVELVKARLVEQRFNLTFEIDNPNDFRLPVRGMVYSLHLNGVKLADSESDTHFTVPANGRQCFEVPVRTNLWRHLKQVVKLLEKPDQPIRYQLRATVKTGWLFGRKVHLKRDGEIIPGDFLPE